MGGSVSSCAGKGSLCAGKDKEKKEPKPEKFPKKRKRRERTKKLADQVDQQETAINQLRTTASELTPRLSQHDNGLVEDRIRDIEHKHGNLKSSVQQKLKGYSIVESDLDGIKEEAEQYLAWLDQCEETTKEDISLGSDVREAERKLEDIKALETELSQKQVTLEAISQKAQTLLADLPSRERDSVEKLIATVQTRHNELYGSVSEKCRILEEMADERREFSERLENMNKWLQDREKSADSFDTIRLLASEVDRQIDKCKSVTSKVQNQADRMNEIKAKANTLKQSCNEEGKEEIEKLVEELTKRYEALLQRLKQQQNNLRDCSSSRKKFEGDCQKIDRWCKETEIDCETSFPLDSSFEVLQEQHKICMNLSNTVQVFDSLVKETKSLGESYFPTLYEEDKPILQKQLNSLEAKFMRVSKLVQDRIQALDNTVKARNQTQEEITACEQWLRSLQNEIKQANVPIGSDVKDAELLLKVFEGIDEKLANYKPSMQELNMRVERLRADGQFQEAEDILKLIDLYQTLTDQVRHHTEACNTAITTRNAFEQQLNEKEAWIKQCEDNVREVTAQGLPVSERLSRYKLIFEELQQQEPGIMAVSDKAHQIGKQGTEEDMATVTGRVGALKKRLEALKSDLQGHMNQCETIQREKASFEAAVTDVVSWFEEKEDALATCGVLHLDANKITRVIEKHKQTSAEAIEKLQAIKGKADSERRQFDAIEESFPQEFTEKLEEIKALEESIVVAVSKKEQYLNEAHTDRVQFENSMKQIGEWLRGAEELLDSGYDGFDYDTLASTLSEYSDYFTEASLCQDEIEQITELSEKLLPNLDANDTATMKQTLKNVDKKYNSVMTASHNKQATMEQKVAQWKNFQEELSEMNGKLDVLESEWEEIEKNSDASPDAVQTHLELVKTFLEHAETNRPLIDNLNDLARELERTGNTNSRVVINRLLSTVNHRWEHLTGQAEARVSTLEEIGGQWGDFSSMLSSVNTLVHETETRIKIISPDVSSYAELCDLKNALKEITQNLERIEPQVARLQSTSLTLQKALPTAEAKISSQEHFMVLVERYERLVEKVRIESTYIQEEVNHRERFLSEIEQSTTWLEDTLATVQATDADSEDVPEKLNRHRMYQQELGIRMEQSKRLEIAEESKYSTNERELPSEMKEKLDELHALEQRVLTALSEKEEELLHIREDREEYKAVLQIVTAWLQKADMQLQDKIININTARENHQALLLEFDDFKTNLDKLRTKGGDIIRHSPDPEEKRIVQKTLADINRQWLSLQVQTADRTKELSEAADLSHAIDDVAISVKEWADHAESVIGQELEWTDFDKLKEQLKAHRGIQKEIDPNQDKVIALNAMVKQLEQVCDSTENMVRVGELKQQVATIQTKAGVQLSALEDANKKMENFEKEVNDLMRWLEQTRARMTMRDTTTDLRNQLAVQEVRILFSNSILWSCDKRLFVSGVILDTIFLALLFQFLHKEFSSKSRRTATTLCHSLICQ